MPNVDWSVKIILWFFKTQLLFIIAPLLLLHYWIENWIVLTKNDLKYFFFDKIIEFLKIPYALALSLSEN